MSDTFTKDTAPHHLHPLKTDDQVLAEIEKVLNVPTVLTAELPAAVKKFTADIQTNFERTARRLEELAQVMENKAGALRNKAADLRSAGPDVAAITERWIQYERDSAEHVKYYAPIFNK